MSTDTVVKEPASQTIDIEPSATSQVPARVEQAPLAFPAPQGPPPASPDARPVRTTVMSSPDAAASRELKVERSIVRFSDQVDQLFGAFAEAQGEFTDIERTLKAKIASTRATYEYEYASLDDVLGAVRPALSKHGLAVMQFPFSGGGVVTVRTLLSHKSGQWLYSDLALAGTNLADAQAIGSAVTYLRRYAVMSILGVAPGYDDDGAAASAGARAGSPQPGQRRSQQEPAAQPAKPPPDKPSSPRVASGQDDQHVGQVDEVADRNGGILVRLSTGLVFSSRDQELIGAVKRHAQHRTVVEVVTKPSSNPDKFAPVLVEVIERRDRNA